VPVGAQCAILGLITVHDDLGAFWENFLGPASRRMETVTFRDGATTIGTGTISAGAATFTTASLSLGVHSIVEMESVPQPWRTGSPQDVWPRLYLWYGADSPAVESHLTCCPP